MKAMILAAGRGERMRPLTDHCPKPLLPVGGKPLIVWHLEGLAAAGFRDVVINHAHLGNMIEAALGDGSRWNLHLTYSAEPPGALETAGGIRNALDLLGDEPFLVINGDIFCDWDPAAALTLGQPLRDRGDLAWLLLVPNPEHHTTGDFTLRDGRVGNATEARHTYSGIAVFRAELFAKLERGAVAPLAPLLRQAATAGRVGGALYEGRWTDVGTPQRLAALDAELSH